MIEIRDKEALIHIVKKNSKMSEVNPSLTVINLNVKSKIEIIKCIKNIHDPTICCL